MAKAPLQALLFAPTHWSSILYGKQRVTLREGTRNYKVGKPVMLCCHIANMCVMADVVKVTQCKFYNLPFMELYGLGYRPITDAEILENLQQYYPEFSVLSDVTMIEYANVRGTLIGTNNE